MAYNFSSLQQEFSTIEEWLKKEFSQISTGRANPILLDSINVESYGAYQPIKNIASVTVEEARTLRVSPWDKGVIKSIETAIRDSGLPLSVMADSTGLRVSVPMLTAESKVSLVKLCKEKLEDARVKVRLARQATDKDIAETEKAEDDAFRAKEELQKLVDGVNKKLEEQFIKKESDITTV